MTTPQTIVLTSEERAECRRILDSPGVPSFRRQRALILLLAERRPGERGPTNETIAQLAGVNRRTVTRVRTSFFRDGFARTLQGEPLAHPGSRKLTRDQELRVLALLDTPPPPGHSRWTVRTLAHAATQLEGMPEVSRELVRRLLKRQRAEAEREELQEISAVAGA
jgi:hypothetical protein